MRQDRGRSLLHRMFPGRVRWMILQRTVYSTDDSCHNISTVTGPSSAFYNTHLHPNPSLSFFLRLLNVHSQLPAVLQWRVLSLQTLFSH